MRNARRMVGGSAVLMVATLLGLAGCSQEPGQASPAATAPSHGASSPQASTSNGRDSLAHFDACGIFTAAEREKYDLPKGKRPEISTNPRDCRWVVRDTSFGAGFTINIQDHGIDEIRNADSPPEPIEVNGREAVQWTSSGGAVCVITFGYGPQQAIDIIGGVSYAKDESITECDVVKKFAKIVEPKLPERN